MTNRNPAPAEPDPPAEPVVDLGAILAAAGPQRRAVLDVRSINVAAFGLGEILELSRATDTAPERLAAVLRTGSSADKGRVAIALAWLIARRAEPELTLAEVQSWSIEIRGAPAAAAANPSRPRGRTSKPTARRSSRGSGG